ncbi:unnamed protein product [Brassica napus]|uniref:(rape) hypothetical protein n=1 Tax=Brassica napus TaxID=3708 RepID=A0A817AZN9_BRANA|nr:unnamed protein product [Brassica napus]
MIFRIIILVFIALGSHGRVCSSHQPPTNQSNPNPSFPVNQMGSQGHSTPGAELHDEDQSNQTSSPPVYPTQPSPNPARTKHSFAHALNSSRSNYLNPQFPMRVPPFPAHPPPPGWSNNQSHSVPSHPTQEEQHSNTIPQSHSPSHPPPLDETISILVYQRASQSPDPPSQRNLTLPFTMFQQIFHWSDLLSQRNLTLPCPMIQQRFQWSDPPSQSIQAHSRPLPHEFHTMDRLSLCVLNYFFAGGPSYTSTWSQRPNLSTSIHIQCFLNQAAFSLFLLANAVFSRTRPVLAFVLDRLSFFLIVISAYLASMPMFPPYFAIIILLVVAIVYIFARFRSNT